MNHITRHEREGVVIYYPSEQAAVEPRLRSQIVVREGGIQISNWSVTPSKDVARELPEALEEALRDYKALSRKSASARRKSPSTDTVTPPSTEEE